MVRGLKSGIALQAKCTTRVLEQVKVALATYARESDSKNILEMYIFFILS